MNNRQMRNEYWNGKEMRAIVANQHAIQMQVQFGISIEESAVKSSIHTEHEIVFRTRNSAPEHKPPVVLVSADTVTALFGIKDEGRTAVLNFASYKNPGGKFMEGSAAQEESLCHASTLYNVLRSPVFNEYYAYNRTHLNNGLYLNRSIYSPDIIFFGSDGNGPYLDQKNADVITCAAPNVRQFCRTADCFNPDNRNIVDETIYERCRYVLTIAEHHGVDNLILGAFGCGVFGCDPRVVSRMFKKAIRDCPVNFKQIIFAIPNNGHSSDNFYEFAKTFDVL